MAAACWRAIPEHFPQATLDEWIIMPDHVHGIITIAPGARADDGTASDTCHDTSPSRVRAKVGAKNLSPLPRSPLPCGTGTSRTLGSIVRGFKIGVTKSLGESPWQRNYYEIIVRDGRALNAIRAYIRDNPTNTDVRRYGPPHFSVGNRDLLKLPLTAFLASRTGSGAAPSRVNDWPIRPACVISGFLSPLERVVFDQCLAGDIPMIQILARGLPASSSPQVQRAIASGRLLVLSPFPPEQATCRLEQPVRIASGTPYRHRPIIARRYAGLPSRRHARQQANHNFTGGGCLDNALPPTARSTASSTSRFRMGRCCRAAFRPKSTRSW